MKIVVETLQTFREIHIIEADDYETAKKIALDSDYNMSKFLGTQILTVYPHSEERLKQFQNEDDYFWEGVKSVDAEGYLCYQHPGGEPVRSESGEKIL